MGWWCPSFSIGAVVVNVLAGTAVDNSSKSLAPINVTSLSVSFVDLLRCCMVNLS